MEENETSQREKTILANNKINKYVFISMGVGLIPIPLADMAILTGLQLTMISSISKIYGIKFTKSIVKSILGSIIGGAFPVSTAMPLASLAKAIPVIGHTASAITMPVTCGATTYAIGKVFLQHFASGGTFLSFNPEKVRDYFSEQFKEGQKVAAEINT